MKVILKSKETIENLYSEKELSDLSIVESFYVIRILKALAESLENGFIEVSEMNENGQVFSEKYNIWLSHFVQLQQSNQWFAVRIIKPISTRFAVNSVVWCRYISDRKDFILKTVCGKYEQEFGFAYLSNLVRIDGETDI